MKDNPKGFLLDVGCGFGRRRSFAALGYDYVGIDYSVDSEHCDKRGESASDLDVIADAHRLPFKSETFSAVNSTAVMEHLYAPDVACRETFRVLKPGGVFVGSCSFLEGYHLESQYHMSYLGLFRILANAGFEVRFLYPGPSVVEMHGARFFYHFPGWKRMAKIHNALYRWLMRSRKSEAEVFMRELESAAVICFEARRPS